MSFGVVLDQDEVVSVDVSSDLGLGEVLAGDIDLDSVRVWARLGC